jgi:hypothetical protein
VWVYPPNFGGHNFEPELYLPVVKQAEESALLPLMGDFVHGLSMAPHLIWPLVLCLSLPIDLG